MTGDLRPPAVREQRIGSFRARHSTYPPNDARPLHAHHDLLVYRISAGSIDERIGRKTFDCSAGSVIVMPAGVDHADGYGPAGASNFTIAVSAEALRPVADELKVVAPVHLTGGSALALLAEAEREARTNDSDSPAALESLIIELLVNTRIQSDRMVNRPAWMPRVISRLHDSPTDALSLAELSVAAGVHPVHLAATFRRTVGCTIGMYTRRLRIARALRLLRSTDDAIAHVAAACGFADQSHLCRVMRSLTAKSPSMFRRSRAPQAGA